MSAQVVIGCVVCGAQTDRFLCGSERSGSGCLGELLRRLGDCAALVEELNTTISRQGKTGGSSVGYVTNGGDEQPLPLESGAMEAGLRLRDRLCSWARLLWEDNAPRDEDGAVPVIDVQIGIVSVSRWLMRHPTWIALCVAADDLYDELTECLRLAWQAVDAAPGKVYIGPCSTTIDHWWGDDDARPEGPAPQCEAELYAREGDWEKRCPACSSIHDVRERQDALNGAVEAQYVRLDVLVGTMDGRGVRLTTPVLRGLRRRGRVTAWVRCDRDGTAVDQFGEQIRPWIAGDPVAARLYRVGEVLDAIANRYKHAA